MFKPMRIMVNPATGATTRVMVETLKEARQIAAKRLKVPMKKIRVLYGWGYSQRRRNEKDI